MAGLAGYFSRFLCDDGQVRLEEPDLPLVPCGSGEPWFVLFVPGRPYPQPRPRVVRFGPKCPLCKLRRDARATVRAGAAGTAAADFKVAVASAFARALPSRPATGPFELEVLHVIPPPASLLLKGGGLRRGARLWPIGARDGDAENYYKPTADALEGILYENDCQVVVQRSAKMWALGNTPTGVLIRWRPVTPSLRDAAE